MKRQKDTINLVEEFEVAEGYWFSLTRILNATLYCRYVFKIIKTALHLAYLVQEEENPTYLSTQRIGEELLKDFSPSERKDVVDFLLIYWKRKDFFKKFTKTVKFKNILGQG